MTELPVWDDGRWTNNSRMREWLFAHLRDQDSKWTEGDREHYHDWAEREIYRPSAVPEDKFERAMWFAASFWDFDLLRKLYPEIEQWINWPTLKKGQRRPKLLAFRDKTVRGFNKQVDVFMAAEYARRIKALWKHHCGRVNRPGLLKAVDFAVEYAKEAGHPVKAEQIERELKRKFGRPRPRQFAL